MEIKRVGLDRLPEIVEMNSVVFEGMYDWPVYNLDDYKKRLEGVNPTVFVAEEDGKIVGNSISFDKDGELYLWILGVLKEYRGQGVATKLFDLVEQYVREQKYEKVSSKVYNVSKEMLGVMAKRGYKIVDVQKHSNPKYDANILELSL